MTTQETFSIVKRPTLIDGIVFWRAWTLVPSAVSQTTMGSDGDGDRPISPARDGGIVVRLAPVSKTMGLVSLPLNVTFTQNTPPSLCTSAVSVITDFSTRSNCLTLFRDWADGPSFGLDFEFRPRASSAPLTSP